MNITSSPRARRGRSLAIAATLLAPLVAPLVDSTATQAASNSLSFENGEAQVTVGPNAAIYIDGTIVYDAACHHAGEGKITDFVYPATDVYLVTAGSASIGTTLQDVGGNDPNTVVATSSGLFAGELVAVVTPSGSLGAGTYDIVYDTCQDGVVGVDDKVFGAAVTVELPDGELPPVDPSILQVKELARQQYAFWLQAHIALTALFNVEEAQALIECILAPSPGCLADLLTKLFGIDSPTGLPMNWIKDQTLQLVMNRAKNYGAIWQDPPDADFRRLPVVVPEDVSESPASGSAVADALDALTEPLADEGALAEALLHAIERYQGAQAEGDAEWALVQARAVADLSGALADQLSTSTAVQDVRDVLAADIDGITARATAANAVHSRIRMSGFDADERRALANRGFDAAAITDLETSFVDDGPIVVPAGAHLLATFDGLIAARSEMVTALEASEAGWNDLAASLESSVATPVPVAVAGGPYVAAGATVQLDAGASTTPDGSTIVSFEWDLDGDGEFDDATGATPTLAVDDAMVVAVRVTNDAGRAAVDAAVISATPPAGPTIDAVSPAPAALATVGDTTTFEVSATGAPGEDVTYEWRFDGGDVAGTGATLAYTPDADDVGERLLTVTVASGGRTASRVWWVSTLAVDGDGDGWTATSDCDDARADVHPGGFERLGNERDDDCDPRTPDTPVGGLAGEVWSWGFFSGLGTGSGITSGVPARVTTLPDDVRAVESAFRSGYALLTDGTVRSWGLNHDGDLGDGTYTSSLVPVTVQNVGGGGALGNVIDVSSDGGHSVALLADGTVRAWGRNANRELGDGSAVASRSTPVVVLDEGGEPLSGVAQVDTSNGTSYALMQDGTVKVFGSDRCVGGLSGPMRSVATTNPLLGDDIVQVETGSNTMTILLAADGTVRTCAAYTPLLGRPVTSMAEALTPGQVTGFGPGSGAIDVALGYESGVVLREDGTVWTWGHNLNHSLDVLGVAGGAVQWTPVQVPLPPGPPVIDIETDNASTMFATRADGSVLAWGANVYSGGGVGHSGYAIVGTPTIALGGQAISVTNSMWNGLALVHPVEPGAEPVRPIHWIDVTVDDAEIGEGTGGAVTVHLSEAASVDVTVEYEFDGAAGSAVVPAGSTSAAVPVADADDAVDEPDQDLAFTITSASHGATIARHTAVVTVVDDDAAPGVTVADVTVAEGDTSLTDVSVVLALTSTSARDIVIDYTTADGTATTGSPGDYTAASGSLLIPAGSASGVVHLRVVGDSALESTETFSLQLTGAEHATIGDGDAVVSIVDDEPLVVTVSSPTVTEGDAGTTDADFTVSVTTPPAGETVTVAWALGAGTAELGSDVTPASGELTLDAAIPNATVVAGVVGDTVDEDLLAETFRLTVGEAVSSHGRRVVLADSQVATILDDDDVPVVAVDAGADVNGSEGSAVAIVGSVDVADGAALAATIAWSVDDAQCVVADPAALATSVTCADETTATLTLTADDGTGSTSADSAILTVGNVEPTVTITAPADGSAVAVGTPVSVAATIVDPGSADAVTCSVRWGDDPSSTACGAVHVFDSPGAFTIVVTADDGDGGVGTASVGVVVGDAAPAPEPEPGWDFEGFFAPVDNVPVINVVRAGATGPLKFSLGGDHGFDIFAAGSPASVSRPCDGQAGDVLEETATPGSSTLTYDPATGRYHYNWKTSREWSGTCRRLVLRFVDGTEVSAEFRFR